MAYASELLSAPHLADLHGPHVMGERASQGACDSSIAEGESEARTAPSRFCTGPSMAWVQGSVGSCMCNHRPSEHLSISCEKARLRCKSLDA
eukprot:382005-Rhodomonas_salina.1